MTITVERTDPATAGIRLPGPRKPVDAIVLPAADSEPEPEDPEPSRRGRWLALPLVALLGWFLFSNRATIVSGFVGLHTASPGWLLVAAVAGAALTLAAAVAQNGALESRIPLGTMCAVQLAGSLVNQVLPAGTGAMGVTMRFLRRRGLSRASAAAALGLNQVAGFIVHISLLVGVLTLDPGSVSLPSPSVEWVVIGGLVAVPIGLGVAVARRTPRRERSVARTGPTAKARAELGRLRIVMRDPARAAELWVGSLATPLLQGIVLWAVARSVGAQLSPWHVVALYLAASTLSAVVPTPGGLGALDLTIAAMLIGAGMPSAAAATATVAFRLMTAWLPLVPAGAALVVLSRRRLI